MIREAILRAMVYPRRNWSAPPAPVKRLRVYVSGGMSGLPDLNFPAFHRAAASLRESGYEVVNPAEMDEADAAPKEWHEYLRRDIKALMDCDAIAMLPAWEKSKGARLEKHNAEELGMRVIYLQGLGS